MPHGIIFLKAQIAPAPHPAIDGSILSYAVPMNTHEMIVVSSPSRLLDRGLLQSPGGFAWWYADMVNERGDGMVMIWSFGLPFLPGLASAARQGKPTLPVQRPSLNICVYKAGKLEAYLLQEYEPDQAQWISEDEHGKTSWRFGDSTFERHRQAHAITLNAELNCPMPGSSERLRGHLRIEGVPRQAHEGADQEALDPAHDWTPLMGPAQGQLELWLGQEAMSVEGRAYHDRNGGQSPLHELGFSHWIWGRVPFEDQERIYYVLWPQGGGQPLCLGMSIDASGQTTLLRELELRLSQPARSLAGGLSYHQRVELFDQGKLWLDAKLVHLVDEGPFYLRSMIQAMAPGVTGSPYAIGIAEHCRPDQIDLAIHRPLVKMRVHHANTTPRQADNSLWVPLFTGPRQGRLGRLVRHMLNPGRR